MPKIEQGSQKIIIMLLEQGKKPQTLFRLFYYNQMSNDEVPNL